MSGAARSSHGTENLYARQYFVTCAKTYGVQAIDSVYIDIKDVAGLTKQCIEGKHGALQCDQVS